MMQWFWNKLFINSWNKTINYTFLIFKEMNLIEKIELNQVLKFLNNKKWDNIEEFIVNFFEKITFKDNLDNNKKIMIDNFYKFVFYHAYFKKWKLQKFSLLKIINKEVDEVEFNHQKRHYYYNFLDEFKKIKNYNKYLIKLLRKVI
ncbi:hypothetical protein JXZ92_00475 [Mycoplasma sp. CSL10137]|nr:hypothetical protein [Mycoplasma sp. CSL10137]